MRGIPLTAVLAALLLAGPAAPAEGPAPAFDAKACEALAEEWFRAQGEEARRAVEERARALPPLPADQVKPLADRLLAMAKRNGPRLATRGRATLYEDPKAKKDEERGLYLVAGAKPRGGLLIAMHGGGEGVGSADSALGVFAGAASQGLTVIAPQAMDLVSSSWNEEKQERFVLDLVDAARRTLDVDTNRVYLAGHSMGGDGSWMIAGRNADRIAGAAPLAGSVMPYMRGSAVNRRGTPLEDYEGLMEGVLPNLMHVALWIYHSADDENEAVHPDDIATKRLARFQGTWPERYVFRYDRVDGMKHALPKGGVKPIVKWLVEHVRDPHPKEVVWETWWGWKDRMYWLRATGHAARWPWRWHARVTAPNEVDVAFTTRPVVGRSNPPEGALTILLSPRLFDLSKPLKVTSGKKVLHEGPVARSFFALLVSIAPRGDPEQWYEGHVDVRVPRRMWWEFGDPEPMK